MSRIKKILRDVKYRCKKNGIDFDLKFDDFDVIPDYCPILGLEINYEGDRGLCICSPSIDRINPSKGYTPDNVMIISYRANRIKSDATISELCSVISYVWRYYHANYVPQEAHGHEDEGDSVGRPQR